MVVLALMEAQDHQDLKEPVEDTQMGVVEVTVVQDFKEAMEDMGRVEIAAVVIVALDLMAVQGRQPGLH